MRRILTVTARREIPSISAVDFTVPSAANEMINFIWSLRPRLELAKKEFSRTLTNLRQACLEHRHTTPSVFRRNLSRFTSLWQYLQSGITERKFSSNIQMTRARESPPRNSSVCKEYSMLPVCRGRLRQLKKRRYVEFTLAIKQDTILQGFE